MLTRDPIRSSSTLSQEQIHNTPDGQSGLIPRNFQDRAQAPNVIDKAWQALIVSLETGWFKHIDFSRLDPFGNFYLFRVLEDDLTDKVRRGTALDVIMVVIRVAEAIAVGLNFAR